MGQQIDYQDVFSTLVCDTPVPYYDMGISCGLPNEMGDVPPEMMLVPGILTMGLNVSMVKARGDSMIGIGIHDGDMLMVESTSRFNNEDVVAAVLDGEIMLKTYYMDEQGRHWLVPANDRYKATLLKEEMNVRFLGRLMWHFNKPHDTMRNIRATIARSEEDTPTPLPLKGESEYSHAYFSLQAVKEESSNEPTGALASAQAKEYWKRLRRHGFVDEDCQLMPGITRKQAMYIADVMSDKLGLRSKWKPFQTLWGISNLAQEKWACRQTGTLPSRYEEIDDILED